MNENNILDTEQSVQNDNVVSESLENTDSQTMIEGSGADPNGDLVESEGLASLPQVIDIPEYSMENPLPVVLVEEDEPQEELEVFALTGKYNGTISDTYLDYFEGIVQKLKPNEHYVIWRSGQYAYTMAWGEDVQLDGTYFSGEANSCVLYRSSDNYNSDWYVEWGSDNVSLSATDLFVYSDLGQFPTVERGLSSYEGMAILFAVCVGFLFMLTTNIFNCVSKRINNK